MNPLKELRLEKKLTQREVAEYTGVSLRSYKSYENDESKVNSIKYEYLLQKLNELVSVDEEHGIISIDEIKSTCAKVFEKYEINFCYLFGSYAKGKAVEVSDIDLLISCKIKGISYFGMVEELRNALHKRVDVLNVNQLYTNPDLINEILKDGIKIYG